MNNNYPDIYQMVTDRILELLEKGVVPWKHFANNRNMGVPMNLITKKAYRGINRFLLAAGGYSSPYWLTYKQARSKGGHVKAGEKSTIVVFWKKMSYEKKNEETGEKEIKNSLFLRYYRVFNVEQCEGLKGVPTIDNDVKDNDPIAAAKEIVANMPNRPTITYVKKAVAFYSPALDVINMCGLKFCKSSSQFYTTLFHELVHSTGHASRLNRFAEDQEELRSMGGKASYAAEELVAEMGAAMLAAQCGIFQEEESNMASYIAGWLKALKDDKKMVVFAAAKAQKAAEYINPEEGEEGEEEEEE